MSLPVFPSLPGLTLTVVKTAKFNSLIVASPNDYEIRLSQTVNPLWSWTLVYDFLHDLYWGGFTTVTELRTLLGFFMQQSGQAGAFLYTDPDDCTIGPALIGGAPNTPLAQLQIVTDGAGNYYSPIQRTFDGVFYEDVTDLNGTPTVYNNGALATVGTGAGQYQVLGPGLALPGQSFMGMYLKWGSEPAGPITIACSFYFRVRFASDSMGPEKFVNTLNAAANPPAGQGGGVWTIGGSESTNGDSTVVLQQVRPVPVY